MPGDSVGGGGWGRRVEGLQYGRVSGSSRPIDARGRYITPPENMSHEFLKSTPRVMCSPSDNMASVPTRVFAGRVCYFLSWR